MSDNFCHHCKVSTEGWCPNRRAEKRVAELRHALLSELDEARAEVERLRSSVREQAAIIRNYRSGALPSPLVEADDAE